MPWIKELASQKRRLRYRACRRVLKLKRDHQNEELWLSRGEAPSKCLFHFWELCHNELRKEHMIVSS